MPQRVEATPLGQTYETESDDGEDITVTDDESEEDSVHSSNDELGEFIVDDLTEQP